MKKIALFLMCIFFAVGCSMPNKKASEAVEKYLNDYKGLSDNVLANIDDIVKKEKDLEDKDRDTYKEILKKQYRDMTYKIENESLDGDTANVTVKITVYDLYKVEKDSSKYLSTHRDEFVTNGTYDSKKYISYKLEAMKNVNEVVSYTIVIKTIKVDGKWQVEQPNDETLEKIHGIYNYEND